MSNLFFNKLTSDKWEYVPTLIIQALVKWVCFHFVFWKKTKKICELSLFCFKVSKPTSWGHYSYAPLLLTISDGLSSSWDTAIHWLVIEVVDLVIWSVYYVYLSSSEASKCHRCEIKFSYKINELYSNIWHFVWKIIISTWEQFIHWIFS